MQKAGRYLIFPGFLVLILTIGFLFNLAAAGKTRSFVRKKDNGQTISETEWNRAVTYIRKKFARSFLKGIREKNSKFTNSEFLRARIKSLLKEGGFDWGEKSLNRYWAALFGFAVKQEMGALNSQTPSTASLPSSSSSIVSSAAASNMDKLILVDNGSFHFTFRANGDRGGHYAFRMTGSGLVIYAHRLLSTLLEKGVKPDKNTFDFYRIYPQTLKLHYTGNIKNSRHITWENISDFVETTTRAWNITREFRLPRPDPTFTASQITSWEMRVRRLWKRQGCEGGFAIHDYSPAGGPVEIIPSFSGRFKGSVHFVKKGTVNNRPINLSQEVRVPIVFSFSGVRNVKNGVSDFTYNTEACITQQSTPFSTKQFTLSKEGTGAFVPHYFSSQKRNPSATVLSDHRFTVTYRYTLTLPGDTHVEAVLENPPRNWRPKGGEESNTVSVRAYLKDPDKTGIFRFILTDVSRERGIAMNMGNDRGFDYEFADDLPAPSNFNPPVKTATGWSIETKHESNEATVTIRAKDYGAWARLKARVKVDGVWQDCQTEDEKGYVTVPYDADENHIADVWEEEMNVTGRPATWDEDDQPKEIEYHKGDGFTNYEEYRGFMVGGKWRSTDPRQMDIFIFDEIGYGIGYFKNTKLQIHLINEDEYDSRRVVNFNRGYATLQSQNGQKGLHLLEKDLGESDPVTGLTEGEVSTIGTPNVVNWVAINTITVTEHEKWFELISEQEDRLAGLEKLYARMKELYEAGDIDGLLEAHDRYLGIDEETTEETIGMSEGTKREIAEEEIANIKAELDDLRSRIEEEKATLKRGVELDETVAHELGHAVNLPHHGNPFSEIELAEERGHAVAVQGGKWSGDLKCVMRYTHAKEYQGKDGKIHKYPPDYHDPLQTQFCTTKEGKGNPAGDATEGECWKRITLKGRHYNGKN